MSDFEPPLPQPAPDPHTAVVAVPMSFGQILERIANLLRAHYKTFIAVGMLPIGAMILIEALFFGALAAAGVFRHPPAQPDPALILWTMFPASVLFFLALLTVYGLYYGASSYVAVQVDLDISVTARDAFAHAWSNMGRYVWLILLRSLIITVPIVVCMIVVSGGAAALGLFHKGNQNAAALFLLIPLGILLYGAAIVYAILATLRLSLAFCACVHENITARQALRRSSMLTNGAKGRIFLALLVIYAIGYALFFAFYILGIIAFVIVSLAGFGHLQGATPLAYVFVAILALCVLVAVVVWAILLMSAYSIAFAVIYRDQCLRIDSPRTLATQPAAPPLNGFNTV
jgi:hypothetical protein